MRNNTLFLNLFGDVCLFDLIFFRPMNNLSVIQGRVFLGRTGAKLGLMFLLKDTTQWRRWGSNPRPLCLFGDVCKGIGLPTDGASTVNSEIFTRVFLSRNFEVSWKQTPREIAKCLCRLLIKCIFCLSRGLWALQICLLTLFAKIELSWKILNLQ